MKLVPFLVALAILPGVEALAAPNTYTFNGSFVSAGQLDPSGNYTSVYVATNRESVPPTERTTYMEIAKRTCDADACVEVVAYGFIPNEDFNYTATSAELATTIVPSADLEVRASRVELGTGIVTELPPPTGPVSVSFRKSRSFTQSQHGVVTRTTGSVSVKQVGASTRSSALASGSILGTPAPSKGEMGTGRGITISVSRGGATP